MLQTLEWSHALGRLQPSRGHVMCRKRVAPTFAAQPARASLNPRPGALRGMRAYIRSPFLQVACAVAGVRQVYDKDSINTGMCQDIRDHRVAGDRGVGRCYEKGGYTRCSADIARSRTERGNAQRRIGRWVPSLRSGP